MPVDPETPESGDEETSAAEEWRRMAMAAGYLSAGGVQVAGGAWVGHFLGKLADEKLGWDGVLAVGLAFAGFAAGVYQMYRTIQLLQRRQGSGKSGTSK